MPRHRGRFDPENPQPYELSRSNEWANFGEQPPIDFVQSIE